MDENENLNSSQPIPSIESFNSLLNDMNKSKFMNQFNEEIDQTDIKPNNDLLKLKTRSTNFSTCFEIFMHFILISIEFLVFALSFVLLFPSTIVIIIDVGISFYSIIMMNYVFFVSSIVSYTMAPIYQSLSEDWINFSFSFTQVILASPLIAFYIFYILKSVVSLASFVSEIPSVIKEILLIIKGYYRDAFFSIFYDFYDTDVILLEYDCDDIGISLLLFLVSLGVFILSAGFSYVLFCFDKTIIMFGLICYIITTIQIFIIISPSYLYFFQTLFNVKCKEAKYVIKYIKFVNKIMDNFSDNSKSDKSKNEELVQSESIESISENSQPITKIKINKKRLKNKNKSMKLLDDPFIEDYAEENDDADAKLSKLSNMLVQLLTAESYYSIYYYSKTIAFDKHKKCRKIVLMHVFFILNLAVIIYDIYKLTQNYTALFLSSIIIRILMIPLFSYYNIFSVLFYRAKDSVLNIVLFVASILTIIIAVAIAVCYQFTSIYQSKYRISNLNYNSIFNNYTVANPSILNHPICTYDIFGVSPIDAFGYSLGGYDYKRNFTIFENQMKYFFGENLSHIDYKIHEINEHFLFIQYHNSLINTTIFGFRGYNSGPEVAFQLEILATHYIIPFFEDIVPFYEIINEYWLEFYTDFLNSFGLNFFENNNLMVEYVNLIIDIYNKEKLDEQDRVLFAGINTGGAIAKIVGTLLKRKSISFISFPIDNDLLNIMFNFSPFYISLVTNVYNVDGFFSDQEPRYATNIGISIPVFDEKKYCTSGACEINSKTDSVYRTFCTMTEICGKGDKFNYYCKDVIGENDLETIREGLREND